jgi:hypothetical protein
MSSSTASIWPFRRILKSTTVVGDGGYDATSATEAIEEGETPIFLVLYGKKSLKGAKLMCFRWNRSRCVWTVFHLQSRPT